MATGSMIIQFDYDDEDLSISSIEKKAHFVLSRYMQDYINTIEHLEVAPGNLMNAFGIEDV